MKLDKTDREFFRTVAKVAFCNPFKAESLDLYCQIAGGKYDAGVIQRKKVVT